MGSSDSNTLRRFLWPGFEIAAQIAKEKLDILNAAM
ncbi:hypothetical protein GGE16_002426 [Rhizobium leguminosarum]|uniref:Uncharacterized protein n=1 Tax=Rhizobium leguminosarum TaxID=384 RepID=A0AAE2MJ62_RHILE|nr:hypothetical protein [Rhizobium leguminosarum]MBB4431489.1 hypothetical protein [Rhizobium esperanzae]MBB4297029.1 hypothetical protein [Rhizobium leguminosarum]MBB4307709.1 hypothetical protein [Rhizobium leguminosarum]MBB4415545.1 hypothetical protein [Rhizobium leguminosarum]